MKKFNFFLFVVFLAAHAAAQTVAGFENLVLPADTFWNGSDQTGGFYSGNAYFTNSYNANWSAWSGFTYSNKKDTVTQGSANQYSAITGGGFGGSAMYAVANDYGDAKVRLTAGCDGSAVKGFYVTNAAYAYYSMKNGDQFAKKFGGATGTDPDWFRLNVQGWENGTLKPQKVEFYLADYRSSDSTQDYILKTWAWVDLQPLGSVDSLVFHLESTDTAGGFGMNTPAYFVLDNFTTYETLSPVGGGFETLGLPADTFWNGSDLSGGFTSDHGFFTNNYNANGGYWSGFTYSSKKDSVTAGSANQYSAITAAGANGSATYAVANDYGNARILLAGESTTKPIKGFYVTNATYAYYSMRDGDQFAKKFGGATGTDADWFKLTVYGYLNGAMKAQSVDFYLADYRDTLSANDYIVRDWLWVDLQPLGNVDSLEFHLSSTDTAGGFGMNNPAYFAMDNFTAYAAPVANNDVVTVNYLNDTLISILANDENLAYDAFTVEPVGTSLIAGSVVNVVCGQLHYTPAVGIVAADTLYYRVVDAYGIADTALVVINVTGVTGVEEVINTDIAFTVFPNPFTGTNVNLLTGDDVIGSEVYVYDITGKQVYSTTITGRLVQLNTETLNAGIYLVKIGNTVKRIVKQ
jgi:hypothetical protein